MCLFCRTQRKNRAVLGHHWLPLYLFFPTMEVNGAPKLPGYKLSSNYLPLCSAEQTHSYRFGTTSGWVNEDRIYIFGWTIPLKTSHIFTDIIYFYTSVIYLLLESCRYVVLLCIKINTSYKLFAGYNLHDRESGVALKLLPLFNNEKGVHFRSSPWHLFWSSPSQLDSNWWSVYLFLFEPAPAESGRCLCSSPCALWRKTHWN